MTTRMQLVVTDDREEHDGRGLTDIGDDGEKIIISIDGVVRELDLNAKNAAALRADMAPWIAAGHQPGEAPVPAPRPGPPAGERLKGQGRRREIPGTRDFYRGLREWAGESGIEVPQAGRADDKKNYSYKRLLPPYLAHLRAVAAGGEDGGVAAARLAMADLLSLPGTGTARENVS